MFERPWFLALLALVVPIVWLAMRTRAPVHGVQRVLATLLSCLAVACLAMALAGPLRLGPPPHTTRVAVVAVAVPGSSTPAALQEWRAQTPWADPFWVVRAAAHPAIGERGAAALPEAIGAPDVAAALDAALHLVPEHEGGAVALWSDGGDAGNDPAALLADLTRRGITLHVRRVEVPERGMRLAGVRHPAAVHELEPFMVQATIVAPALAASLEASLEVREGGAVVGRRELRLRAGTATLDVEVVPRGKGVVTLDTALSIEGRASEALQRERSALLVEGRPLVLQLGAQGGDALRTTLERQGIDVRAADGTLGAQELSRADALVVDDLPADQWPRESQERVKDAVLHDGLGLLVAGAHRSLGPGGYADSPLASILPVEMPQREERRDPSVSLVIILDTSGSMGGSRIELAKEVARLAVRRLMPHDKVGIVEFYGSKRWAAPLQPASNTIEVQRALNRLQAGGGTIIYSALEEAFYALLNVRTRFKHILVLTDGGVEQGPFEQLARRMAEAGMNCSTVLIGPQANSDFLVDLAQWGRGRFYACPSRFQLPDLRFKEPQSSPLPAVQEQDIALERSGFHDATLSLAGQSLPQSHGLVEAKLVPGASLLVAASGERPFLAGWDQGRGRVLAWCSELLGPMADDLRQHPAYGALLGDVVRGLAQAHAAARPELVVRAQESALEVELRDSGAPTFPLPRLEWSAGDARGVVDMSPAQAGRFMARLDWPASGAVTLQVERAGTVLRGAAQAPLPRTGRSADAWPALQALALASGGTASGDLPLEASASGHVVPVPFARLLGLAALCCFLLALLVRRWPARAGAFAALLLLATPLHAQQPDALQARSTQEQDAVRSRITQELQQKGQLDDLAKEWAHGTLEQRLALAHAQSDLPAVLALLPDDAAHAGERALLLEALGRVPQALAELEQALAQRDLKPLERAGWLLRRGELELASGRKDAGAASLRAAVQAAGDATFAYRVGHLAAGYGLLDLALELEAPPAEPKAALACRLRRALWQEQAGRVDQARAEYAAALELAKLKRDRRFVLARMVGLMRRAGRLAELVHEWQARTDLDIEEQRALVLVLRELGQGEQALAFLERLAADGESSELKAQALAVAVESGDTDRAVASARARLSAHPEDSRMRGALALLLTDLRCVEEAEHTLIDGMQSPRGPRDLLLLEQAAMDLSLPHAIETGLEQLRKSEREQDRLQAVVLKAQWLHRRKHDAEATALLLGSRKLVTKPEQRVVLGEALERHGETQAALELYRLAYKDTHAEDLALRLGWLLAPSKKDDERREAYALFRHVWLNAASEARRVQVEERVLDMAAKEGTLADLALELEKDLADPRTENREAKRHALVKIYGRAQDTIGAELVLQAFAKEPGHEIEAWEDMARMHLESQEFTANERCLRHLIEIDPAHELDYREQLAMSALERGRPTEARAVIHEMLGQGKQATDVAFEFSAGIYMLAARFEDAVRVYRRSLALHPDRIETLLLLGNALRGAGRPQQAIAMYCDILLQEVPDDLLLVAADGLLNMDAEPAVLRFAERAVRRRLAATPDKVHLHRMLQDILETLKDDPARRRDLAETVLVAGEQRTTFVRELMDEAQSRGEWPAYVDAAQDLLFLGDEVPPTVFAEIGEALLKLKDYKAAERAFARARMATDFTAMERRVAAAYADAGLIQDAERVWRRVLRRDPDDPAPMLQVAALCEQRGASKEALALYTSAAVKLLANEAPADAEPRGRAITLPTGQVVRSARSGGGAVALSVVAAGGAGAFGNNRNKEDTGPGADEALAGALRCAPHFEDLEPLRAEVTTLLHDAGHKPAQRLGWLARLRQLDAPADDPARMKELRQAEDELIAAAPHDARVSQSIIAWRIEDGDLAAAASLLEGHAAAGFDRNAFQLALLQGEPKKALDMALAAPAREQAAALRTFHLLGDGPAAETLLGKLEDRAREKPAAAGALWSTSARLLGKKIDASLVDEQRLAQALEVQDGERRTGAVLAALRQCKALTKERKVELLLQILPGAMQDKQGNQATAFLAVAKDLLPPSDLAPLVEKSLRTLPNPYMLTQRLPFLNLMPPAQRAELLDAALKSIPAAERNSHVLRIIATRNDLDPDLRRSLVEGLHLTSLQLADRHWFAMLCLETALPQDLGATLFEKCAALHDDALHWMLGARLATDAREKAARTRTAAEIFCKQTQLDYNDQQLAAAIARALPEHALEEWPFLHEARTVPARVVRAEYLRAHGDLLAGVRIWRSLFDEKPDDLTVLNKLLDLLQAAGDSKQQAQVLRAHIARASQLYPYQAARLAQVLLDESQPSQALDVLALAKDTTGSNLALRLEAITSLDDAARRAREARGWLQDLQRLPRRNRGMMMLGAQRQKGPGEPRDALGPLPIPLPAPRERKDWKRGMPELDLLAFLPEGEELARSRLRTLEQDQRDEEPALYRGLVGSARESGHADALLAAMHARLQQNPADPEALRTLFAAAQCGLPIEPEILEHEIRRRLCAANTSLPFLGDALLLAHQGHLDALAKRLLDPLLDRSNLQNYQLAPWTPAILAIAAQLEPERLLELLPGDEPPSFNFDGELLIALQGHADPALVLAGCAGMSDYLRDGERVAWRERIALPWCGWQLRAGNLDGALQALAACDRPMEGDGFVPQALGAAIPPLAEWKDAAQQGKLRDALLHDVDPSSARGFLMLRLAVVLAMRLEAANDHAAAAALLQDIERASKDSPALRPWLDAARGNAK